MGVRALKGVVKLRVLVGEIVKLILKGRETRVGETREVETWGIKTLWMSWMICSEVFMFTLECFSRAFFSSPLVRFSNNSLVYWR